MQPLVPSSSSLWDSSRRFLSAADGLAGVDLCTRFLWCLRRTLLQQSPHQLVSELSFQSFVGTGSVRMGLNVVPRHGERAWVLQLPGSGHGVWWLGAPELGDPGSTLGTAAVRMSRQRENTKSHRLPSRLKCGLRCVGPARQTWLWVRRAEQSARLLPVGPQSCGAGAVEGSHELQPAAVPVPAKPVC